MLTSALADTAQQYLDGNRPSDIVMPYGPPSLGALSVIAGDDMAPATRVAMNTMITTWSQKLPRNNKRIRYYLMKETLKNMGISVPPQLQRFYAVSGWASKAVKALVSRSRFDGFTFDDDHMESILTDTIQSNNFGVLYRQAATDELISGCAFLTASPGGPGEPTIIVNAYPATLATGLWNPRTKSLAYGLAITDVDKSYRPTRVVVYAPEASYDLTNTGGIWQCQAIKNNTGRPLMVCMAHEPSLIYPFGRSRISRAVMGIVDEAVRETLREAIAAEMFTAPRRWISGATEKFAKALSAQKDEAYLGNIMTITSNGNTNPQVGQFAASSLEPHISYMRDLAARFSGETNIPVSSLGVVSDNPSSAEAIYAAKEDMVIDAENLNETNGGTLQQLACLILAINQNMTVADLPSEQKGVVAQFRNPAMPSVVSQADAMTKLASAAPWIAQSDVFLEEIGFNRSEIARLRTARQRYSAQQTVSSALASLGRANNTSENSTAQETASNDVEDQTEDVDNQTEEA